MVLGESLLLLQSASYDYAFPRLFTCVMYPSAPTCTTSTALTRGKRCALWLRHHQSRRLLQVKRIRGCLFHRYAQRHLPKLGQHDGVPELVLLPGV